MGWEDHQKRLGNISEYAGAAWSIEAIHQCHSRMTLPGIFDDILPREDVDPYLFGLKIASYAFLAASTVFMEAELKPHSSSHCQIDTVNKEHYIGACVNMVPRP